MNFYSNTIVYDHVIIGAGASGLYTAYNLKKKFPDQKIIILESSENIGGRARNINWNGKIINLGAEHIRPTDHYLLKLIKNLGLNFHDKKIAIETTKTNEWIKEKITILENFASQISHERYIFTSKEIILKNKLLSEEDYQNFLHSYGYTDFTESDFLDTVRHYGFRDFYQETQNNLFHKIDWNFLWKEISKNINILYKTTVTNIVQNAYDYEIVCNQNDFIKGINIYYCGTIYNAKSLLRNFKKSYLLDNIDTYPFVKIFIKTKHELFSKNILHTHTNLQRIVKHDATLYCLYCDSEKAIEVSKHLQNISWFESELLKIFNKKVIIEDIYPIYWNSGTHYFKPLTRKYDTREKYRSDLQHFERNFFILGEMVSKNQGWVEGALESYHLVFGDDDNFLNEFEIPDFKNITEIKHKQTSENKILIKQKGILNKNFIDGWKKLPLKNLIEIEEFFYKDSHTYLICKKPELNNSINNFLTSTKSFVSNKIFNIYFSILMLHRNNLMYDLTDLSQIYILSNEVYLLPFTIGINNKNQIVKNCLETLTLLPELFLPIFKSKEIEKIYEGLEEIISLNCFLKIPFFSEKYKNQFNIKYILEKKSLKSANLSIQICDDIREKLFNSNYYFFENENYFDIWDETDFTCVIINTINHIKILHTSGSKNSYENFLRIIFNK